MEDVYKWLLDVVCIYLCAIMMYSHHLQVGVPEVTANLFKEKEVDGQVLLLLKEDDFKNEFNTSFGQRKKIVMLRDDTISKGKCMYRYRVGGHTQHTSFFHQHTFSYNHSISSLL